MRGIMVSLGVFGFVVGTAVAVNDAPSTRSPREALQAFGDLIGSWRGTVTATVAPGARQQFWTETLAWEWQFKGKDAWLKVTDAKGKHFTGGELRYLPEKEQFALTVRTPDKHSLTFTGPLKGRVLTLQREENGELQRFVFTFLHPERHLYKYEVRPAGKALFALRYKVGATREGVPFAAGDGKPECVVSGGLGTMPVTYMGKTYYVCCSGCRDEFRENPAKYVAEYEAKKAKKK